MDIELNLERPRPPASQKPPPPPDFIDLTRSPSSPQFNLVRPPRKANAGLSSATPPAPIILERPLRKAKSAQSYAGMAPSDKASGMNPQWTDEDWTADKLAFPRSKVGDRCRLIVGG